MQRKVDYNILFKKIRDYDNVEMQFGIYMSILHKEKKNNNNNEVKTETELQLYFSTVEIDLLTVQSVKK